MKILFCIDSPGYGGSEINAFKLIDHLKRKHEIDLLVGFDRSREMDNFIGLNRVKASSYVNPNSSKNLVKGLMSAFREVRKHKVDIFLVWSHHLNSNRWLQIALALSGKRFVVIEQLLPTDYALIFRKSKLTRPFKRFVGSKAVGTIICSMSQMASYKRHFQTNKLIVIPNSRQVAYIEDRVLKSRINVSKASSQINIGCIARLTDQKDQKTLLTAVSKIMGQFNIHVILAGEGESRPELETLANRLGLKNVAFTGFVEDVFEILAQCDVFVLPSLEEGLPGALIEAMAARIPCIVSDIPGNSELVEPHITGLLFPPGSSNALSEAIKYVIDNPAEVKDWTENAYKKVALNYDEVIEFRKWSSFLDHVKSTSYRYKSKK